MILDVGCGYTLHGDVNVDMSKQKQDTNMHPIIILLGILALFTVLVTVAMIVYFGLPEHITNPNPLNNPEWHHLRP